MDSSIRISSGAVSDRGLSEKRPENEDSYLEMSQCGIYAVADGVGGAQAGDVASQMAMEILGEAFTNRHDGDDAETVMRSAIERANAAIYQMAHELPQLASMATTVVALHLTGNIATIGHVGDSRLYRVDRDGNLHRETDDHSMVAEEVRAGRMTEEQAENHPSRNIISRALGAERAVDIDLKTIMVEPGNVFLICSDGITRHVGDPEIKGVLTFGGAPDEICEYLKGLCYERGAEDNLTAVVVKVSDADNPNIEAAPLEIPDAEEPTVATVRPPFDSNTLDDDDELLELETLKLPRPQTVLDHPEEPQDDEDTIACDDEPVDEEPDAESVAVPVDAEPMPPTMENAEAFSMSGDSETVDFEQEKAVSLGRIAAAVGMLLLGSVIGLGVYHFALAPRPTDTDAQKLSVMKTDDIPFSAFEKNRRNVDADPAAFLRDVPPPNDAEDYYLRGRASLLTGDFPAARLALIEAQKRIGNVEPANAKILNTDIATALMITNDPTMQGRLKTELDASTRQAANTSTNR